MARIVVNRFAMLIRQFVVYVVRKKSLCEKKFFLNFFKQHKGSYLSLCNGPTGFREYSHHLVRLQDSVLSILHVACGRKSNFIFVLPIMSGRVSFARLVYNQPEPSPTSFPFPHHSPEQTSSRIRLVKSQVAARQSIVHPISIPRVSQ